MRNAAVGIGISLVTTYIIFKITETNLTWEVLRKVNFIFLIFAVAFQILFWLIWALRLKKISHFLGFNVSYLYSLKTTLSSMFVAAITPSSAGGEPVRVKMISEKGLPIGVGTFVVLTERILDSLFFAIALPIFLILSGFSTALGFRVAVLFVFILLVFLYILYLILRDDRNAQRFSKFFSKLFRKKRLEIRIFEELKNFRNGTLTLLSKPISLIYLFTLTAVMWSFGFMIPSLILLSFATDPEFLLSYTSQLIIVVISLIPLTPGSSGIVETTMAYLYSNFVDLSILGSLIAIWRFITYYLNLICGTIAINLSAIRKFQLT
ncbi:MAG: flippase-like domain-containing protein [Archaeoglobaceae archaeon]